MCLVYHTMLDHTLSLTCATSQDNSESTTVTQYHYLHWPEGGKPKGTASILKMAADLVKTQSSTGNKGITVMCKSAGKTVYHTLMYMNKNSLKLDIVHRRMLNCTMLQLSVFTIQWWCGQDRCIHLHLFSAREDQDCSNSWHFSVCQELSAPASWLCQDLGEN